MQRAAESTYGMGVRPAGSPRIVSAAGVTALRSALQAHLRDGAIADEQWRRAIGLMCAEARRADLQPEHLIVALKRAITDTGDAHRLAPQERQELTRRLVTSCIEEYFARDRDHK